MNLKKQRKFDVKGFDETQGKLSGFCLVCNAQRHFTRYVSRDDDKKVKLPSDCKVQGSLTKLLHVCKSCGYVLGSNDKKSQTSRREEISRKFDEKRIRRKLL